MARDETETEWTPAYNVVRPCVCGHMYAQHFRVPRAAPVAGACTPDVCRCNRYTPTEVPDGA